jgi:ubiquinone/menaquinone biosynthesis C-methylase UbiE
MDEVWEELHSNGSWGEYPEIEVVRHFKQLCKTNPVKLRVVDIGCGGGAHTKFLAETGFDTFAFDGSQSAVRQAQKFVNSAGLHAEVIVSDAVSMQYESGYFDCALESAVLYANNTSDIMTILSEVNRVLRVGGSFFSTGLFTIECTGVETGQMVETGTYTNCKSGVFQNRGLVHCFTDQEIVQWWEDSGFHIRSIDKIQRTQDNGALTVVYYYVDAYRDR